MQILTYHEVPDGTTCVGCKYLKLDLNWWCSLFENMEYKLYLDPISFAPLKCEACMIATSATFDYHIDIPATNINAG